MKLAFLTNILPPYRVYFFDQLNAQLGGENLKVFVMTDALPLRPWNYHDLKRDYTALLSGKKIIWHGNDYLFSSDAVKSILKYSPDALIVAGSWTPSDLNHKYVTRNLKIFIGQVAA